MREMVPREAGGNQNKLWHRLVLDQKVTPLHYPATTRTQAPDKALPLQPDFLIPAQIYLPQPLTREHLLSKPNPLYSMWFLTYLGTYGLGSNIRTTASLELLLWKAAWPP